MPPGLAAARIDAELGSGENPLPGPRAGGIDIFAMESVGQINGAAATGEVLPVQFADARKMRLERAFEAGGQHGDTSTIAFAFDDGDAAVSKIDIFDAQPRCFEQAQAASIKEMGHEAVISFKMSEDGARFVPGKNNRESRWAADALDAADEGQLAIEDLLVKKKQSAEGLVLSGGCYVAIDGKMTQEGGDLVFAHLLWMALVVEEDETANPIDIGLLGADAIALKAEVPADAV